ncbi:hypothetical protein NK118_15350, partial [Lachnospiraceae bacterium PAL227]
EERKERLEEYLDKSNWDLSGSIFECVKRYSNQLSDEELEQIFLGLEAGLNEKQIKAYFCLPLRDMEIYRRAYEQILTS